MAQKVVKLDVVQDPIFRNAIITVEPCSFLAVDGCSQWHSHHMYRDFCKAGINGMNVLFVLTPAFYQHQ
jgi:hypothetical protein